MDRALAAGARRASCCRIKGSVFPGQSSDRKTAKHQFRNRCSAAYKTKSLLQSSQDYSGSKPLLNILDRRPTRSSPDRHRFLNNDHQHRCLLHGANADASSSPPEAFACMSVAKILSSKSENFPPWHKLQKHTTSFPAPLGRAPRRRGGGGEGHRIRILAA